MFKLESNFAKAFATFTAIGLIALFTMMVIGF